MARRTFSRQEGQNLMKEKNTKKGFNFERAKHVGDKFKGAKIAKTFRIDMDVFVWLRGEADRTGIPYQTLLNAKLREAMQAPTLARSSAMRAGRAAGPIIITSI